MIQRRTFLKSVGSILSVLGASETAWLWGGNRSLVALAQPSPRKFAVLVGIDRYMHLPALRGCATDVSLQRELLMNRFGFKRENILEFVNDRASRAAIEAVFRESLPQQVKPGDTVVFHFSGYGTQVKSGGVLDSLENALIPVDGNADDNISNYLLEETILLLLRSLRTNQVIAFFDTSYFGVSADVPGQVTTRFRPFIPGISVASEELELRKQLKGKVTPYQPAIIRAVNSPNVAAREVDFSGFTAGAFSYAWTQYLWGAHPEVNLQKCLTKTSSIVYSFGLNQEPALNNAKKIKYNYIFADSILKKMSPGAVGAINGMEEDQKTFLVWLGGLASPVINLYGNSSLLQTIGTPNSSILQLRSRDGLKCKVQNANPESTAILPLGTLVQEYLRVIPRDIKLVVGLNPQLERIERVDATSAIAAIEDTITVMADEQPIDCLFGRLGVAASNGNNSLPTRYGLFTLGGELLPNTASDAGEAVKQATKRLEPKLMSLIAAKLWHQTENEVSSQLNIQATLEITNSVAPRAALQRQTLTASNINKPSKILETGLKTSSGNLPTIPIGSRIQFRVENRHSVPVYVMLVGLDSNKNAIALFPWSVPKDSPALQTQPILEDIVIAPQEVKVIPRTPPGFEWTLQGLTATWELQLLASTQPWKETLKVLGSENKPTRECPIVLTLDKPVEVSQALLQDIHNASAATAQKYAIASDHYAWDVKSWASLKFTFQVV